MSNLIRYIIQEDPEKQMKKNELDYAKYPTWAPIQKQSQEDKYKGYKFSSKNLLENSFNSLTSNKSSQNKEESSKIGNIFSPKSKGRGIYLPFPLFIIFNKTKYANLLFNL